MLRHEDGLHEPPFTIDPQELWTINLKDEALQRKWALLEPVGLGQRHYHMRSRDICLNQICWRVDVKKRTMSRVIHEEFNDKLGINIKLGANNDNTSIPLKR